MRLDERLGISELAKFQQYSSSSGHWHPAGISEAPATVGIRSHDAIELIELLGNGPQTSRRWLKNTAVGPREGD